MKYCEVLVLTKPRYSTRASYFRGNLPYFGLLVIFFASVVLPRNTVVAQMANVSQQVLPTVDLNNLDLIREFLEEQFILPADPNYRSAVFLDVTRDGFGVNDVLILYPSEEYFQLSDYLPERMMNVLSEQNLESDYSLYTSREMNEILADEAEAEEDPKKALAGAMLRSLLSYMPAGDFQGYIHQVGEDVRISFWGYDENAWRFIPSANQCIQPDDDPMIMVVHKMPQIQSFLDADGCAVIQASTTAAEVTSRVCE